MVIKGHFSNGVIVLDEQATLAEGVVVSIVTDELAEPKSHQPKSATILDLFSDLVGKATNLPTDAAANVDHYLYGLPKSE